MNTTHTLSLINGGQSPKFKTKSSAHLELVNDQKAVGIRAQQAVDISSGLAHGKAIIECALELWGGDATIVLQELEALQLEIENNISETECGVQEKLL